MEDNTPRSGFTNPSRPNYSSGRPTPPSNAGGPPPPMPSRPQFQAPQTKRKKSRAGLWIFLVLLLLAATAAGVYFWQNGKVSELQTKNTTLQQQVTALQNGQDDTEEPEEETEAAPTAGTTVKEIATGQVTQETAGDNAAVTCLIAGGALEEFWVQYGDTTNVAKTTPVQTQGLGAGTEGEYGSFAASIPGSELTNGELYFYQCAGKQDGKTVYGGVASFDAKK